MKKTIAMLFTASLATLSSGAIAFEFPANWSEWKGVNTTLTGIGALPGCEADVSSLPPIYQETVATYCALREGGPGKVNILVAPGSESNYQKRDGHFSDGPQMALHLIDLKAIMFTGYSNGLPVYRTYGEDGKNLTNAMPQLSEETCIVCHTGYEAFCLNGQCGTAK
ncbi:MAG: hypothetical protein HOL04_06640 [Gammaproteobacteria bacterium]|jgi:hypothetical protein|nr:hypothetical protein [Gammaproteobacteria bacterium]MBT4607262.1 hypothetical protein [Thiotrichales bacterium]MBT3473182.1 hypothetical protein [Gammaproteobacteria bacterium]MBT3967781.1 hypothetical protein [Gammaproteobacteria bacterium]MBT4079203.1 hypothetical protein [Gammaproteobacteria bacterium]